ncbi:uncharacterized protein LOC130744072 [Lotus japonicus]|uniref:uncharacterized protein LOC130744072 n=1 Tax=Lotus japonicus TaxID=34305 RepID=UPI0025844BC5|nr:uncharacterized protein LOC130744072 [Lotus japonicus]
MYASPVSFQRETLWGHLAYLRSQFVIPWMMVGDFNEPSGPWGGGRFTWFRKHNNRIVLSKRLERALGDVDLRVSFLEAFVEILHRVRSDHFLLPVHYWGKQPQFSGRPFRFLTTWEDHAEYQALLENAWRESGKEINRILGQVKTESITFNEDVFVAHNGNGTPELGLEVEGVGEGGDVCLVLQNGIQNNEQRFRYRLAAHCKWRIRSTI